MGLFLAVFGIGHAKAAHVVGAHVHAEEVSGGRGAEFALGIFAFLVEGGGAVVVAECGGIGARTGDRVGRRPRKSGWRIHCQRVA